MSDTQRPHGLQPTRLLCPWDFPGKSTGVGCHCLLREAWAVLCKHHLQTSFIPWIRRVVTFLSSIATDILGWPKSSFRFFISCYRKIQTNFLANPVYVLKVYHLKEQYTSHLHIAVNRRETKGKGEKERYTHSNAEFQRIARRDKKAFVNNQCKEIEENNRMGKTRYLFRKIRE